MNCSDFQELISAQLDQELTPQEEQILAQHLKVCTHCASFKKALEEIEVATLAWRNVTIPAYLEKKILNRTVNRKRTKVPLFSFLRGYYRVPRSLAWASAFLLLLLIINSILNPLRTISEKEGLKKPTQTRAGVQKIILTDKDVIKTYIVYQKKNNL